jgi:formate hydrogenlyase transcriptional activator
VGEARKNVDVPLDTLTRQRALLDGLFARVPEAIVLLDADNRILHVNPEFTRVFGYDQEEACGCRISELVAPEESSVEPGEYTRRRLPGESLNVEGVRKRKDGTRVDLSILSAPVSIAGSQICEYVIYRDITERKRAEQKLRESEVYLAEAQRLSQTGSWAWNPETGDIRYWSETCYRVLGFDPAGPLPRFEDFFHRIHPNDQAATREQFEQAIRDKVDFEMNYRVIHPAGEIRDIHAVGHAVLDGSGDLCEFLGTVIDETEHNRAKQELRQSEADLRTKNDRLKLLLNVTNQITSNLELRELLRAISANIRGVMQCDMVAITLPNGPFERQRLVVLDFPNGKGLIREGLLLTPVGPGGSALESLKPTLVSALDPNAFSPEVREIAIAEGLQQHCVIPLANRGRALGALVIARTTDVSFSPDDLEFLAQVSGQIAIAVENALAYHQISELKDKLAQEKLYLEEEIHSEMNFNDIVGNSQPLRRVLKEIETVAPADSTVLVYGETGTGKELIARAVHNLSSRKSNTFVKLNCAAIPTGLIESELFGHEKGAFTGAITQRVGRFELANRGSIFLDEIGEIPLELQPKLLRVLQEREFERLGSTRTLRTDARLIAATNRDLKAMVDEQKFRSDLYYRLNVFPIRVPALRERKEDIPLLVRHFVKEFTRRNQRVIDTIPSESMEALIRYHWPGNIRELQNVIERAVLISKGLILNVSLAELKPELSSASGLSSITGKPASHENLQDMVEWTERDQILRALEETNGVVSGPNGAAARLGVKRSTLQHKMRRLGIRLSRTALEDGGRPLR